MAFRDRGDVDRARAGVFVGAARVGGRVGRVVIGALAAQELEAGRKPVVDRGRFGRVDEVVAEGQRVDRLVVVHAPEELGLAAGLGFGDLDRRDLGGRRGVGRTCV